MNVFNMKGVTQKLKKKTQMNYKKKNKIEMKIKMQEILVHLKIYQKFRRKKMEKVESKIKLLETRPKKFKKNLKL